MRRVYFDAVQAASTYPTEASQVIAARDLLSDAVKGVLMEEDWTVEEVKSRQTFVVTSVMAPWGYANIDAYCVSATPPGSERQTQWIIADFLPTGYIPPVGYSIYADFEHYPTTNEVVRVIAGFVMEKVGGSLLRVWYEDGVGDCAEVEFLSTVNQEANIGIGGALHAYAGDRGGGGYIFTSKEYNSKSISMYHGTNKRQANYAPVVQPMDVRFGTNLDPDDIIESFSDQISSWPPERGSYYGNCWPVYIFVSPYHCSIVPVVPAGSVQWQSVHCGVLYGYNCSFGYCGYGFRRLSSADRVTYVNDADGIEYRNKTLRLLPLKYKSSAYQLEGIKWISGEAQLSDVFLTMDATNGSKLLGKLPYSFLSFDSLPNPDVTKYTSNFIDSYPLTESSREAYDQGLGTLIHRCS